MNTKNFMCDSILSRSGFEPTLYAESLFFVNVIDKISDLWNYIHTILITIKNFQQWKYAESCDIIYFMSLWHRISSLFNLS